MLLEDEKNLFRESLAAHPDINEFTDFLLREDVRMDSKQDNMYCASLRIESRARLVLDLNHQSRSYLLVVGCRSDEIAHQHRQNGRDALYTGFPRIT